MKIHVARRHDILITWHTCQHTWHTCQHSHYLTYLSTYLTHLSTFSLPDIPVNIPDTPVNILITCALAKLREADIVFRLSVCFSVCLWLGANTEKLMTWNWHNLVWIGSGWSAQLQVKELYLHAWASRSWPHVTIRDVVTAFSCVPLHFNRCEYVLDGILKVNEFQWHFALTFDLGSYFRILKNCRSVVLQFYITWHYINYITYLSLFYELNKSRHIWPSGLTLRTKCNASAQVSCSPLTQFNQLCYY